MIGAGFAGPRRIRAGGARDHLLGAHGVSGFGDSFKAGGRVVKNVTGYDLCKLLAGSWGTLAVMTEVTLKVMPRPKRAHAGLAGARRCHRQPGDDRGTGLAVRCCSGAAHLPNSAFRAEGSELAGLGSTREAVTLLRLEGIAASAAHRAAALGKLMAPFGTAQTIDDAASAAIWSSVCDVIPFAAAGPLGEWPVWRIVCPPASGGALGGPLARDAGGEVIYDWGGGLIWAALPPKPDAQAALVRQRVGAVGGHATLVRASDAGTPQCRWCSIPQPAGARRLERTGPPSLRPEEHPQSRPDDTRVPGGHEDRISRLAQLRRSRYRAGRQDPARLRALRVLHRDLSDLCAARRRAR